MFHATPLKPYDPIYLQLSRILERMIESEDFAPNEQFPTEVTLAIRYQISRGTVRKALELLEEQQLIRREHGRGTFVN